MIEYITSPIIPMINPNKEKKNKVAKIKKMEAIITEHNKKSYKFKDDIIPIDWKLGYFQCAEAIGFKYRKKNEGKFLERLAEEYNIK